MEALDFKEELWSALKTQAQNINNFSIQELSLLDSQRKERFFVRAPGLTLNYANQLLDTSSLDLLKKLGLSIGLQDKIQALFQGQKVNVTENKAALHTALRLPIDSHPIVYNNKNVVAEIMSIRALMQEYAQAIREGLWLGYSGKPISNIIHIGIGGSDFGPKWSFRALEEYKIESLNFHFISDADPESFERAIVNCDAETTLFIVASKSFTTKETLYNLNKAKAWIGDRKDAYKNFIAVTAMPAKAKALGLEFTLPIWDFIGGRFSICSAINFVTMVAIGNENFEEFLKGAHAMDEHFKTATIEENMPILYALIGIWNHNFLHINNLLVLIYSNRLEHFLSYVQQLDMESNGKHVDLNGNLVSYTTGPIVWGGLGNQAQHSYYQLLCQGTHKIAVDFICFAKQKDTHLYKAYLKHESMLTYGKKLDNIADTILGNMPSSTLFLEDKTPFVFGALAALYEHKIYVQSLIWNINCFDQPGVESSKAE